MFDLPPIGSHVDPQEPVLRIYKRHQDGGMEPLVVEEEAPSLVWTLDGDMLAVDGPQAIAEVPTLLEAVRHFLPRLWSVGALKYKHIGCHYI